MGADDPDAVTQHTEREDTRLPRTYRPQLSVSVSLKRAELPHAVDHRLETLLVRKRSGGGMMIGGRVRDVDFLFDDPAEAVAAAIKVHTWAHTEGRSCAWMITGGDEQTRSR